MEISQRRNEFSVYLLDTDVPAAQSLVETLKATGYEGTHYYPTIEALLASARLNPPHMVLVDCEQPLSLIEKFLIELASISPEILPILMISPKQIFWALQLVSRGLAYDSIGRPFVSSLEIVQKLDRAGTQLYFQFESEQVQEFYQHRSEQKAKTKAQTMAINTSMAASDQFDGELDDELDCTNLNQYLTRMAATKDLEQSLRIYLEAASRFLWDTPILYFRYLPGHGSLVVSQAVCLSTERFRGIGIDLNQETGKSIEECLRRPRDIQLLQKLMSEVFQIESFTAVPHFNENDFLGLFVFFEDFDFQDERGVLKTLQGIFEVTYRRNVVLKEKHTLDITDPLTGLYNRKYFSQRLDEEISRARRIFMPLSIVTLDLDGFRELNQRLGVQQADAIVKAVGALLKKTTRNTDVIARVGVDEFVCLLPHTDHSGGVVKAERIRRMIESAQFPLLDKIGWGPLTLSLGVSEYPSFAGDAEGLVRTADEAMMQVKNRGGNQVCLATTVAGFQPDFVPLRVPVNRPMLREEAQ